MKKKYQFVSFMVVLLLLLTLTACGGGDGKKKSDSSGTNLQNNVQLPQDLDDLQQACANAAEDNRRGGSQCNNGHDALPSPLEFITPAAVDGQGQGR